MSVAMASLMQAEALVEARPDRPWLHLSDGLPYTKRALWLQQTAAADLRRALNVLRS